MRDIERIDLFLERLGKCWKKVPDWRFGQLILNVLNDFPRDLFFPEEEEMIDFIEKWFEEMINTGS
jgi:hypothetical protein